MNIIEVKDLTTEILLSLWQRASEQEIGTAIKTDRKQDLLNRLYSARQSSGGFENIIICQPGAFPDQLWLTKKTVELEG